MKHNSKRNRKKLSLENKVLMVTPKNSFSGSPESDHKIIEEQRKLYTSKFGRPRFNNLLASFKHFQLNQYSRIEANEAERAFKYVFPRHKREQIEEDVKLFMRLQSNFNHKKVKLSDWLMMWSKNKRVVVDKFLQLIIH